MSEIWIRKMRTFFDVTDSDKDGVVSKKDFDLIAESLCALKTDDAVFQEELRKSYDDFWMILSGSTKTNVKGLLTEAVMIDSLIKQRKDPKLKAIFRNVSRVFFNALDSNNDGYLQLQEFAKGFCKMCFPETCPAEQAFKVVDTNLDGKTSPDELSHAFLEFMFCEDEDSPYNMYFGYLLESN